MQNSKQNISIFKERRKENNTSNQDEINDDDADDHGIVHRPHGVFRKEERMVSYNCYSGPLGSYPNS